MPSFSQYEHHQNTGRKTVSHTFIFTQSIPTHRLSHQPSYCTALEAPVNYYSAGHKYSL